MFGYPLVEITWQFPILNIVNIDSFCISKSNKSKLLFRQYLLVIWTSVLDTIIYNKYFDSDNYL